MYKTLTTVLKPFNVQILHTITGVRYLYRAERNAYEDCSKQTTRGMYQGILEHTLRFLANK
eukprot:snap_masked-scaffold_36-processed-gene-0.29-mRNA-1 protein AED:1.00 eAED:1.00 QI:0/0/0/0/1/1/2/0/60